MRKETGEKWQHLRTQQQSSKQRMRADHRANRPASNFWTDRMFPASNGDVNAI